MLGPPRDSWTAAGKEQLQYSYPCYSLFLREELYLIGEVVAARGYIERRFSVTSAP